MISGKWSMAGSKWLVASGLLSLLTLAACSQAPKQSLADSRQNPNAPLAFFSIMSNLDDDTRLKYAIAMQNEGIFNFMTEDFSEEQIENHVEVRIVYSEKKEVFNAVPTLYLQVEILQNAQVKFKFTVKETSGVVTVYPRERNREKSFRKEVLLKRFIEELKRLSAEEKNSV